MRKVKALVFVRGAAMQMTRSGRMVAIMGHLLLFLPFSSSFGGGLAANVQVTQLGINKGYGGTFVFIKVSGSPTGAPSCATGYWQFTLTFGNPGDSQLYALLLSAYTTGIPVTILGSGACSEFGQSESLQNINTD